MKNCLVIANITFKEIIRQPFLFIVIFISIFLMIISFSFSLFAFGEESKLTNDMGIATITISGLIVSIFYTANSFSGETKKATIVTILCKSINKGSFILGRFLGTALVIALMNLVLLVAFVFIMTFYNAGANGEQHQESFFKHAFFLFDNNLLLSVYLAFLQILILGAISLLLSINLATVSNISICFTIYIFGHLSGYLNNYFSKTEGSISWLAKIGLLIIPNLHFFDALIFTKEGFNALGVFSYLALTTLYTICYCSIMITIAVLYFHKKDLL